MSQQKRSFERLPVASSPQQRFDEYLQSRGMRSTEQRRILLEFVFQEHEHFDADQLIEKLPTKGEERYVSRPTVYRTLAEFVDAGLLRKFELDGRSVYEHDYGYPEHDHLYCEHCENLIEFRSPELIDLLGKVATEHQFRISGHKLIVKGICEACQKARRRTRKRVDLI